MTQNIRGQQNMQKNHFLFVFSFSKMHFLQQIFHFQFSSGAGGLTKREKLITLHVKQSVKMKSTKKQMHQFRKGAKCVTKYYFPILPLSCVMSQ